jgi:hypothetical protein
MKNYRLTFLISLVGLFAFSVAFAQDRETRNLGGFSKIDVGGIAKVTLKQGSTETADIRVEDLDISDVITEVRGGTLYIKMRDRKNYNRHESVTIQLTYRQIDGIELSGAASVVGESVLQAPEFRIEVSGAGNMQVKVSTQKLKIDVSGAGSLDIDGNADYQQIDLSGAGSVKGFDLMCKKADVEVSGAGSVQLNVQDSLDADVSGAGSVRFKGNPSNRSISKSGVGTVKQVN